MKIKGLHHVSLLVANLETSLAFYKGILGLKEDANRPDLGYPGSWLDLADGRQIHLLLLPNPYAGSTPPAHGGHDRHLALLVDDFDALQERLDRANQAYSLSKSGRSALFCRDPDANAVELIALS